MSINIVSSKDLEFVAARQEALLATIEVGSGSFTPEQRAEFDALGRIYEAHTKADKLRRAGYSGLPSVTPPGVATNPVGGRMAKDLFAIAPQDCGFTSLEEYVAAVKFGDSQRLVKSMAASGGNTGVPSDGGYAVPTSYAWGMLDKSLESEIVRPRADVVPMPSAEFVITDFDDHTHSGGELFAGLAGTWVAEADETNYKTPKLKQLSLKANKLMMLCAATNELLTDATGYRGKLEARMASTIGWNVDRACLISGTGSGQPLSVLNAGSTITVTKEAGQPADTIIYENLTKMFARMHPACLPNAVWVVNQTALPQLLSLSIAVGTGGVHVPVLTESNGTYKILGRPVVFTEKLNALGDLGDIMFVDFTQYVIGLLAGGLRLDVSEHLLFKSDQSVFRIIMRIAGQPKWSQAFTPINGDTLSWAVTLQAR